MMIEGETRESIAELDRAIGGLAAEICACRASLRSIKWSVGAFVGTLLVGAVVTIGSLNRLSNQLSGLIAGQ